ncbi:MAG TPA: hypothetical protein VGA88_14550 [Burkholderiales bacterium]
MDLDEFLFSTAARDINPWEVETFAGGILRAGVFLNPTNLEIKQCN